MFIGVNNSYGYLYQFLQLDIDMALMLLRKIDHQSVVVHCFGSVKLII